MATPIIMPKQNDSAESVVLSRGHKKVGEKVDVGDKLFSYETNKTAFDEVSKVEEGDEVPCLVNVCVIGQKG